MKGIARSIAITVLVGASPLWSAPATQPDLSNLKPNDPVMVREGDTWSKATLTAREGRRYQIKYDDGTTEWVTADRLQLPGATPAAGQPAVQAGTRPATQPAVPAKPPLPTFVIGQKCELKWASTWEPVKVVSKRGDWYLVEYEKWKNWKEWAEPWRMRKVGSTYDIKDMRISNPRVSGNEGPPRPTPGDPPGADGKLAGGDGAPDWPDRDDPFAPPSTGLPVAEVKVPPAKRPATPPAGGWRLAPPAPPVNAKVAAARAGFLPPLEFGVDWGAPRYGNLRVMLPVGTATGFKKSSGLVRVNVATGAVDKFELNSASAALDLSPSGDLVVCRSNGFHFSTKSRLDVYRLGAKIEHVISYFPLGKDDDIIDAFWTDERTVVLISAKGVSAWDVTSVTGKWVVETTRGQAARSPDGKILAIPTAAGIAMVSVADGVVQAMIEGDPGYSELAFSGDGLRLVSYARPTLRTWDLQTGQPDESVSMSDKAPVGSIIAPNKDFVLIGRSLFSLRKKDIVWRYEGSGPMGFGGDRVWSVGSDTKSKFLTSAVLPHPRAVQAAQQAPQATALFKAGMTVTVDIQVEADEAKQAQIRAALTRQLTQAGFKIADDQPLRLTARTEDGPSQTREYQKRGFGRPGGGEVETVTITPKITKLVLEKDGETLWQTSRTSGGDPGIIVSLKEGETIQDKANQRTAVIDWLATAPVPTLIVQTADPTTLPSSTFAQGGVVDK